jgi:ABC-type multidrug transport system permease subunit
MNSAKKKTDENGEIFQEYYQSFWRNSKFWLGVVLVFIFLVFAFIYKKTVIDT